MGREKGYSGVRADRTGVWSPWSAEARARAGKRGREGVSEESGTGRRYGSGEGVGDKNPDGIILRNRKRYCIFCCA